MKKSLCLLFSILFLLITAGCGAQSPDNTPETTTTPQKAFDVDLVGLSSTMIYSEVYNMTSTPENYVGKYVRATGNFSYYHDEAADKYYYACMIADASSCCSQGIEFVLKDSSKPFEEYPEVGTEIIITGTFDFYEENGTRYIQLVDADMTI